MSKIILCSVINNAVRKLCITLLEGMEYRKDVRALYRRYQGMQQVFLRYKFANLTECDELCYALIAAKDKRARKTVCAQATDLLLMLVVDRVVHAPFAAKQRRGKRFKVAMVEDNFNVRRYGIDALLLNIEAVYGK